MMKFLTQIGRQTPATFRYPLDKEYQPPLILTRGPNEDVLSRQPPATFTKIGINYRYCNHISSSAPSAANGAAVENHTFGPAAFVDLP